MWISSLKLNQGSNKLPTLKFTVHSALLEELGSRLVGDPSTALAELIKNSYDADASFVKILLDPKGDLIQVEDDGHGMTLQDFQDYWMRIGSPHKRESRYSRGLKRPLTGSKGVGRLAAQLISKKIKIESVAIKQPREKIIAELNWSKAIKKIDLTEVTITFHIETIVPSKSSYTKISMLGLKQKWNPKAVEELARKIWRLQPPFRIGETIDEKKQRFNVILESPNPEIEIRFKEQIGAILNLWHARATGQNHDGKIRVSLQFKGEHPKIRIFEMEPDVLHLGNYEILFYYLKGRQPYGIRVSEIRKYLEEFGGVQIYDAGFRLPYYGSAAHDWLMLGMDRARRLSKSSLLPSELQVPEGMQFLPHTEHLLGAVYINTSQEDNLDITITRDSLKNAKLKKAFEFLSKMVRLSIDWYAMERMLRVIKLKELEAPVEKVSSELREARKIIETYGEKLPKFAQARIINLINKAQYITNTQESLISKRVAVLNSLATAGISAIGHFHEFTKQINALESIISRIKSIKLKGKKQQELMEIEDNIKEWINSSRNLQKIFSHVMEEDNRKTEKRYHVRFIIDNLIDQMSGVLKGIKTFNNTDSNIRLPSGTFAEWISLFQNIVYNACNAMFDSSTRNLAFLSTESGKCRSVIVEDTGIGLDLKKSSELFEPFIRYVKISPARKELGYGGTGLGLSIVKMIAQSRGAEVSFIKPSKGFRSAFELRWKETK